MALIELTAPGDIVGLLTATFNAQAEIAKAIAAVALDQSTEGRQAAANLNELAALPIHVIRFCNKKLGIGQEDDRSPQTKS